MRSLLSEKFAPITSTIGFLEAPLAEAAEALISWRRRLYPKVKVVRPSEGFPEVLLRLEPLTTRVRPRQLLVSAGSWTAYFDCSATGTDAVSPIGVLSETLECRGLAVSATPHDARLVPGGRQGGVLFELFGPASTNVLYSVRGVSVTFDGNSGRFDASGIEQEFEEVESYGARRIRDRFNSFMLERYCQALGVDVFNPSFYGPDSVFVEMEMEMPSGGLVLSLSAVQDRGKIVPGAVDDMPG